MQVVDTTPPQITVNINPEPNTYGWSNSDVAVSWSVTDPESTFTSMPGCETTIIDTETPGTTLTCSATSAGGTSSQSVTIKLDKTPPLINLVTPAGNASYLYQAIINADWSATDNLSGLDRSENGTVSSGSPIATDSLGDHDFTVSAKDFAGNQNSITVRYTVYEYVLDFLAPLTIERKTYNKNSTFPVKFQLRDNLGRYIPYALARLQVDEGNAIASGKSNFDNYFRYDLLSSQYIYNLSLKSIPLTAEKITLQILLNNRRIFSKTVKIK